jgi:hypothetical protein
VRRCVVLNMRASTLCSAVSSSLLSSLQELTISSCGYMSLGKPACASQLDCKSKIPLPYMRIECFILFIVDTTCSDSSDISCIRLSASVYVSLTLVSSVWPMLALSRVL